MKKISFLFSMFILLTAFTCEDEPLDGDFLTENNASCELATQNTQNAAIAFLSVTAENYSQLCTTYRNALEAQIQFCGDPDGILQTQIESLGFCGDTNPDPCDIAMTLTSVAETAYNEDTSDTTLCNDYRVALENEIAICGDSDGSLQLIIDELGDCTNNQTNEDIVGTWLLTAWIGEEPIDLNNDGTESVNFLDEMNCYENETIVFNADNTAVAMSTSYASFIFEIEVGTTNEYDYVIECEFENENTNSTWTQNGNIITVDDGTTVYDATINGDQLSVFVPEGFVAFSSDFTATTIQDLTFIYTKQ
ncbi:lipocalin family protein [Psychroserpens ponticola]|uniref:Lipocalin family protein n=1 Tax=Psychroserpens ponticola TaxID=2932268 RepID=A0ABY7S0X5_9FLAO|nr:lipocalin family protein [Psychroserpens ponticola]WCO03039.1 lipocalin family protein [Psychroserpens ponticola]